jgi:hydroxypyruvate isomerase
MDNAAIYRELRKQGYRGWVAMEFLPVGDAASELRRTAPEIS